LIKIIYNLAPAVYSCLEDDAFLTSWKDYEIKSKRSDVFLILVIVERELNWLFENMEENGPSFGGEWNACDWIEGCENGVCDYCGNRSM
jgi:hypothetical protein